MRFNISVELVDEVQGEGVSLKSSNEGNELVIVSVNGQPGVHAKLSALKKALAEVENFNSVYKTESKEAVSN